MLLTLPSPCHKLSHLLGPPPTSSVTYFMDGPMDVNNVCEIEVGFVQVIMNTNVIKE